MEATNDPQPLPFKDQPPALTTSPRDQMRESLRESGAAFVETVKALKAADSFGPTERGQAMEILCYTKTRMQAAMLDAVLGRVPASPEDCMDLLTFPVLHKAEALRRMKIVAEVTGKDIEDPILWLARLQRGAKLSVTQNLMWRMIGAKLLDEIPPPPKPPKDERALSNAQPIIDALEQGRNVILMGYHGNMPPIMGPIEDYLSDKGIPRIIVANSVDRDGLGGCSSTRLIPISS